VPCILLCCSAQNVNLFHHMQERLPMELRDMIYAHLWDEDTIWKYQSAMTIPAVTRPCEQASPEWQDFTCRQLANEPVAPTLSSCSSHAQQPFFVKPGYVGEQSAREVVEAWYRAASKVNLENWSNLSLKGAESLICQDAFYVGLDPATVLRKLSLKIDVTKAILREPFQSGT
jgi:hypothetical protein